MQPSQPSHTHPAWGQGLSGGRGSHGVLELLLLLLGVAPPPGPDWGEGAGGGASLVPPRFLPAPHGPVGLAGEPGLRGKSWEVSLPFGIGKLRHRGEKKG